MTQWIYENAEKILYYYDFELFKVNLKLMKVYKLSFAEFIREIDTCPDEGSKWKKEMIIKFAEKVGMIHE